ncbi:MAG: ABC transporter permease subunit [Phycisphaerales bacterium]|nr:MAG: ABC transporter permease subunit [Phycisphaerales bacterium]
MRSQVLRLLCNEIAKAARRKLPYFGLFAGGLVCGLTYIVADELSAADTANAWGYVALSMQLVFTDIGLIFVLVFAALLMAEETRSGTIRAALAAPVYRWELYLAKAITGLLYMIVMSTVSLALSMVLAKVHYHFSAVADSFGVVYSRATVLGNFLLACVLSWIPLAAIVAYGLLVSTIIRSPGAAVAVSIGTLYIIDFTKHLVGLDPYIFTKYIGYPWQVLQQIAQGVDYRWQPTIWKMLGLSCAYTVVALAGGMVLFLRQDLND